MDIVEKNLEESFKRVKKDIFSMQAHLLELSGMQAEILKMIEDLTKKVESGSSNKKLSKKKK